MNYTKYHALLKYRVKATHPDINYIIPNYGGSLEKTLEHRFSLEDTFYIDQSQFCGYESITNHIAVEMLLTAGGGYTFGNLKDVELFINGSRIELF